MRRLFTFPSAALGAAVLLGALAVGPVQAAGWVAALKNTPAEAFDAEDLQMFLNAAGQALNAEGTPEVITWSNPATGAGGRFQELRRSAGADGRTCKRMRVWVSSKKRAETASVWNACKSTEGRWELSAAK
ncbi:RT0821/Lpp0805 family surface protein [Mitsuaria sp. GD03876]|uniref:RT0821/Lpp0805 family surface protein n=1 Tax=Mitsuaria sp. GD03876 TaxID=2975399 RepID=UPI00244A8FB9|nr:RT0821/Lpp0805 family surface protein [Mitsuaria sp. GD03876]MDH0864531.1 RT0821/Lpp0805 family surface protein [Mitsuaria sp. GD03876]